MKTTKERKRLSALLTKASKIKKEKKAKGFTLVELIVVIAIIGVLAVVLVPNMLSYIDKAALSTANDTAAKIAEQANLIVVDLESRDRADGVKAINSTYTEADLADDDVDSVGYQLNNAIPDLKKNGDKFFMEIKDGSVLYVVYAEDTSTDEVGTWPKLTNLDVIKDGYNITNFSDGKYAQSGKSTDIKAAGGGEDAGDDEG